MHSRTAKGFTLIELMVTLVVMAVVAAIAFPNFQQLIRSSRVSTANNEFIGLINLARTEAIRSGQGGGVCGSSTGASCDGAWAQGVAAVSDPNGDGALNDGTVLRFVDIKNALTVTGPSAVIAFDGRGRRLAPKDQTFKVRSATCNTNAQQQRTLVVNASGQVRSTKETCT